MNKIKSLLIVLSFLIVPIVSFGQYADPSPPAAPVCPVPGSSPKAGSGAPVGDSVPFLLALALAYGAIKYRQTIVEKAQEGQIKA